MYVTAILEFSEDDLTDATPTWQDVTSVLLEAEWSGGIQTEGDDPTPGSARFRLHDNSRNFEPDFAAGSFFPNVVPDRRFRLRITSSAVTYAEGIWYSQVFEPVWPQDVTTQQALVSCGDGMTVLALDDLPGLDPPEADSYEDVVNFDEPWGYWRLGEPGGTQAVANFRRVIKGKGKNRRKVKVRRGTRYLTAAEAAGVSGSAGVYRNTPTLGTDSLIVGDRDTAVTFAAALSEYMEVALDADNFRGNKLTVEAWVKVADTGTIRGVVGGPLDAGSVDSVFYVLVSATEGVHFGLQAASSLIAITTSGVVTPGEAKHIVCVYDGSKQLIYVDGADATSSTVDNSGNIVAGAANPKLWVGRMNPAGAGEAYMDGIIDEVAVYEAALTPERILAHYTAGSLRGFGQQTAGERIAEIATSILWSEASIQTTGRDVMPVMQTGQGRLDEIAETAHAEGPRTLFLFEGDGDPKYLGHEWQATAAAYNTVQATFGNAGGPEVPFETVRMMSDDDTYNAVVASHESGESVEVSTGATPLRVNTEWTDVLLMEHNHVEALANHALDFYKVAQFRPAQLELSGADTAARLQILSRQVGDLIRVKHRPRGAGAIIDRVCNIIGFEKRLDAETGHLSCTWYLGRGFNAQDGFWHAGVAGFSEAGVTTDAA